MKTFRVIDSGIRPGREQIAFDEALVELHKQGKVPDTLRFLQFRPTVLIGRHQALAREVKLDYCAEQGIDIARRLTGGGAIYMDQGQLGWELVFKKSSLGNASLPDVTRNICEAVAASLSKLGIDARYRPFSDIEVGGRKLSGTGGYFDGDTLIYQGTVLIELDPATMVNALNIPQATDSDSGARAEQQVVSLAELMSDPPGIFRLRELLVDGLAENLGFEAREEKIGDQEYELARQFHDDEIGTDAFVQSIDDPASDASVLTATRSSPGGRVSSYLRIEGEGAGRIRQVLLTGDFFVAPSRTVLDLEASLRGLPVAEVAGAVDAFFAQQQPAVMSVPSEEFRLVITDALAQAGG